MVDVWWGLCEPAPGVYTFDKYVALAKLCRAKGLKVQATLSMHACGGNVGDSINIPLPPWVVAAADEHSFWFTDRARAVTKEYISFGADHAPVLPAGPRAATGDTRTPVQAYEMFARAFVDAMREHALLGSVVTELQVGVGPCGELRYPGYPMDRWQFPGIGQFQCYDEYLLQDLRKCVQETGSAEVKGAAMPPEGTGGYNDTPRRTEFFRRGYKGEAGRFFLRWYSERMLRHGEDVLKAVRGVVEGEDLVLAVKVSGVHWWKHSASRAAEATSGYMLGAGEPAYGEIARMLKRYDCVLDFTCLEMRTIDQPWLRARCGPRQLVAEVFEAARKEGVRVAGENALERYDDVAYRQIVRAFRRCRAQRYGFTLLRLGDTLMEEDNLKRLGEFVKEMS
ncbi:Beta amylase, GH14, Bam1 [Chondrus crispus]|uniref:Beta-amylase n=1 Tax=Chondrus crispus TaxID=2769 RepID=R7QIE3_CHOCR|nr:Beta amylase, GH14, Bam1 [Chondrus crispus]CDF37844.1 Beta amylase, GH14, Bam1 [Chondrus crispus]|eukprot:XP_005717715.1 Beta amylase, GH14, Bam1 [Chondrus crispus]